MVYMTVEILQSFFSDMNKLLRLFQRKSITSLVQSTISGYFKYSSSLIVPVSVDQIQWMRKQFLASPYAELNSDLLHGTGGMNQPKICLEFFIRFIKFMAHDSVLKFSHHLVALCNQIQYNYGKILLGKWNITLGQVGC